VQSPYPTLTRGVGPFHRTWMEIDAKSILLPVDGTAEPVDCLWRRPQYLWIVSPSAPLFQPPTNKCSRNVRKERTFLRVRVLPVGRHRFPT
jgi:hypothetical protein